MKPFVFRGKRICAFVLCLLLALGAAPGVSAAGITQDRTPIFSGNPMLDYMAGVILNSIPTDGLTTDAQKIAAVYDWIIRNCDREGRGTETYFDRAYLEANAEQWGALYDSLYLQGKIRYHYDMYVSYLAEDMAMYRIGTCAHYAALLNVLLERLGYETYLVAGEFINNDGSRVEHKWNIVLVDDQFYWLDVRMDHSAYERTGRVSHTYFMKTDTDEWAKKHVWDREGYDLDIEISTTEQEYARIKAGTAGAARPNDVVLLVDGQTATLGAYEINGNNYLKLRDVALLLEDVDSPCHFGVGYDAATSTVTIQSGLTYTRIGGEYLGSGLRVRACTPTASATRYNGQPVELDAYEIAGSNYFKLRDLGALIGFGVDWDEQTQTVILTTW